MMMCFKNMKAVLQVNLMGGKKEGKNPYLSIDAIKHSDILFISALGYKLVIFQACILVSR